jgi:C4-dicarboxylate-specific signal transduction histidine kinase
MHLFTEGRGQGEGQNSSFWLYDEHKWQKNNFTLCTSKQKTNRELQKTCHSLKRKIHRFPTCPVSVLLRANYLTLFFGGPVPWKNLYRKLLFTPDNFDQYQPSLKLKSQNENHNRLYLKVLKPAINSIFSSNQKNPASRVVMQVVPKTVNNYFFCFLISTCRVSFLPGPRKGGESAGLQPELPG